MRTEAEIRERIQAYKRQLRTLNNRDQADALLVSALFQRIRELEWVIVAGKYKMAETKRRNKEAQHGDL